MASEAEQAIKRVTRCGDDYYAILGIEKGAGEDEIKKAYRKLALRLHPDKCSEKGAEEAFKRVNEAFSVLSDADKRDTYDRHGVSGLKAGGGGGPGGGINPEDIFEAFFGGQGFPGGTTFVQRGGSGGFQTFSFSSGGPGMGGIHFSGGSPFGGGGGGVRAQQQQQQQQQRRRQQQEAEEEREAQETPQWLKAAQGLAAGLGPLLPIAIMALMALTMLMLGTIIQFFIKRAFVILPIMYLTEGRAKMILLSAVVVLAVFGIM